jgi:hypothetical protein
MPLLNTTCDRRTAFKSFAAWKRSSKGNLWRVWDDYTLTIFKRADSRFGFCIVKQHDREYSVFSFDSEPEAMDTLCDRLFH